MHYLLAWRANFNNFSFSPFGAFFAISVNCLAVLVEIGDWLLICVCLPMAFFCVIGLTFISIFWNCPCVACVKLWHILFLSNCRRCPQTGDFTAIIRVFCWKLAICQASSGRSGQICRTMSAYNAKELVFTWICAKVPDEDCSQVDISVGIFDLRAIIIASK